MSEGIANVDVSEIEITPEMIKAGVEELDAYDGGYMDGPEETVKKIYRTMEAVSAARRPVLEYAT